MASLTFNDPDQPPVWVTEYAQAAVTLLGLHDWRIKIKMRDYPHDDQTADGTAASSARYQEATIHLKRDLQNDAYGHAVLMHEMMEVRTAEMDHTIRRLLELIPEEQREFALMLWRDAAEKTIELTARSLAAHLDDLRATKKRKAKSAPSPAEFHLRQYVSANIENGLPPRLSLEDIT